MDCILDNITIAIFYYLFVIMLFWFQNAFVLKRYVLMYLEVKCHISATYFKMVRK